MPYGMAERLLLSDLDMENRKGQYDLKADCMLRMKILNAVLGTLGVACLASKQGRQWFYLRDELGEYRQTLVWPSTGRRLMLDSPGAVKGRYTLNRKGSFA